MPETLTDTTGHRQRHTGALVGPFLELDLVRELDNLKREPEWASGQNARTMVKHDTLRIVLTALKAGHRIPEHQTDSPISIQTLSGRIHVRAGDRTFDLPGGVLLALEQGVRHDVVAIDDSAFLLTIARPGPADPPESRE
jgi:quercetin dioxygenase-like cupin family protein